MSEEMSEEIEIKEAYITSQSYPILWVGENGYNITRYGKLIKVRPSYYKDKEQMNLIVPTIDFEATDFVFKENRLYIVAGGVSQKLVLIKDIIKVYREEDIEKIVSDELGFTVDTKYELASGIKKKAYGIIYTDKFSIDLFEPLQFKFKDEEIIAKDYPNTFKVFKRNDKIFIKYLQPKDC